MGSHCGDRMCVRCGNLMRQLCYRCRNDMHGTTLGPNLETLDRKNKCEKASHFRPSVSFYKAACKQCQTMVIWYYIIVDRLQVIYRHRVAGYILLPVQLGCSH